MRKRKKGERERKEGQEEEREGEEERKARFSDVATSGPPGNGIFVRDFLSPMKCIQSYRRLLTETLEHRLGCCPVLCQSFLGESSGVPLPRPALFLSPALWLLSSGPGASCPDLHWHPAEAAPEPLCPPARIAGAGCGSRTAPCRRMTQPACSRPMLGLRRPGGGELVTRFSGPCPPSAGVLISALGPRSPGEPNRRPSSP